MKNIMRYVFIGILLCVFSALTAQEYCLEFSKENKRSLLIKEGRNISFIFSQTGNWRKGKLIKITKDSLFIEQHVNKNDISTERESNYLVAGYGLDDFRMMAYNNTAKAVGKGATVIFVAAMVVLSSGSEILNTKFNEKKTRAKNKFFKSNVDFEEGWEAAIINFRSNN